MRLAYLADARVTLLDSLEPATVEVLRRAVMSLADGESSEVVVDGLPAVEAIGAATLTLAASDDDKGVEVIGNSSLRCSLTPDEWRRVAGLLEPFTVRSDGDFFQYLSEQGEIAWIISTSGKW